MDISEESLRDMQLEAKFQTQLLTQQGMYRRQFILGLYTLRFEFSINVQQEL